LPAPSLVPDPSLPPLVDQAKRLVFGDSEMLRHLADAAGGFAVSLALAALILAGALWAAGALSRLTARAIARAHRHHRTDTTLQIFAASLVRYVVLAIGLVAVLEQLGVKATSVIAVLGAASLAIGLALQGALANVAAGVMILILRPYRVGDRVEINGRFGTVKGLDLFATRLADLDSLSVFVPNAKAFGEIIVNYTATTAHRIQIDVVIDFDDDLDRALEVMKATAAADPRALETPAPWARLCGIEDRGLKVRLRAWMAPADWYNGRFDLLKQVHDALRAQGFSFPYPAQVAVETRPFKPPHSKRRAKPSAKGPARSRRKVASQPRRAPRPTTTESEQGL